jgi:30S ribosomal protein S31
MGRGDKKTKRGKIFRGSYGKSRPKPNKLKKHKEDSSKTKKEDKE